MIRQLYELQEIDLEIEEKMEALAQVEMDLEKDYGLNQIKEEVEERRKRLTELERKQRWQEWQLEDIKSKIKEAEKRLYSGKITNPKELISLQEEIEKLKSRYREGEEKLLEIMLEREEEEKVLKEKTSKLEEVQAKYDKIKGELTQKQKELKSALEYLTKWRGSKVVFLDPLLLNLYEEIRRVKRTAVAKIEQGRCCGCYIILSPAEIHKARTGITRCSSCGRILYYAI